MLRGKEYHVFKKKKTNSERKQEREKVMKTFHFNIPEVHMLFGMQITSLS